MKIRQVHLGSMIILLLCLVLNPAIVNANYTYQAGTTETVPALGPTADPPTVDLPTEVPPTETPVTITATPTPTEKGSSPTTTPTDIAASPTPTTAVSEEPTEEVENGETTDGDEIELLIIDSPPHPPAGFEESAVQLPEPNITAGINTLSVPAYDWVFGCAAVSGAMIAAYYDRNGYSNMYTGPTNGGVAPMDSSSWGSFSDGYETYPLNPIIASRNGLDGRTSRGSIEDYWRYYGNTSNDPYITNGWTQHTWTTIGDYMKTSQSAYENSDGSTKFYTYNTSGAQLTCDYLVSQGVTNDGNVGRSQFYKARGYTVEQCYNQLTDSAASSGGFTFNDFKTQINNGNPVMIHVQGHTMVGVGYNDSTNTIYIHDTWDYSTHSMTWGGSYSGMTMYAVSILTLKSISPPAAPTLISPSGSVNTRTPQYVWYAAANATGYWMTIARASDGAYMYNSAVTPNCNATTCWITPSVSLADGTYWYKVTAGNSGGWGSASAALSFTVATQPPAAPTLVSPSGSITSTTPQFVWYVSPGATGYWMTVAKSSGTYVYNSAISPSCNSYTCWITPSLNLADGDYWYQITAGNSVGWGSASSKMNFNVATQPPAAPTLISPSGSISNPNPQFVWYVSPGATAYRMTITKSDSSYTYNSNVPPSCNSYTCWITPSLNLTGGDYWYQITAGNAVGWSSASAKMYFTVSTDPPAAPTLISPNGSISNAAPQFVWYATANATAYWMTVVRSSDGAYLYNSYITPSCNGYTCWITPSLNLSGGSYWFKITAGNSFGWGSASSQMNFTVSLDVPAAPTLILPTGTAPIGSPLFVWYASTNSTAYWLTVVRSSDGAYMFNSYVNPNTNGYACWMTLPGSLANGTYWYKVTAGNSNGWGSASSPMSFTISASSSSRPEFQRDEVIPLLE